MKKLAVALALVTLVGCHKTEKATAAGDSGAAATSTTETPSVVQKALSFVTGSTPFEGDITMNVSDHGKPPQTITYEVKGSKMRFDAPTGRPGGSGYAIMDTSNKKMITVVDAQKLAMVMNMDDVGKGAGPAAAAGAAAAPKIDKTGKTDTVAGYQCDIWNVTAQSGNKSEVCVTKGITWFSSMKDPSKAWMSTLTGEGMFPLRAVTSDPTGKEVSRMEVTKVDKKSIDDSRFEVPAGYKTMDMGDMMKNLGNMRGMGAMGHHPR